MQKEKVPTVKERAFPKDILFTEGFFYNLTHH